MKLTRRLALAAPLCLAGLSGRAATPVPSGLSALAIRSANILSFHADGSRLFEFRAAFGRESGAKRVRDDARTPIGDYTLLPARRSARWRWFLPIDYPNESDIARGRAAGLSRGQLGDEIGVHGFGDWPPIDLAAGHGVGWNWTAGCISVTYAELEVIRTLVHRPIPIRIAP
ncbi:MAG: L,D-transpeptidase [Alphaproteobacteria bacterium]|nr:L,D-transpeptidase [Alphaproteobacteria bacterium]